MLFTWRICPEGTIDFQGFECQGPDDGIARPSLTTAWHNPVIPTVSVVDKLHHAAYIAVGHRGGLVGGNWPRISIGQESRSGKAAADRQ